MQNHYPCDVVVADGGSSDGSLPLEYLSYVKVRVLLTKKSVGNLGSQLRIG